MTEQVEIWRECLAAYEVSNIGRVRRSQPGHRTSVGKVLSPGAGKNGYLTVAPVINGKNKTFYVHDLVAAAFLGARPDGLLVNHMDTNKHNNAASNLEYTTFVGNMTHAVDAGVMSHGEDHYNAKLDEEKIRAIRADRKAGLSYRNLAAKYLIAISHAWQVVNGGAWRHVQ